MTDHKKPMGGDGADSITPTEIDSHRHPREDKSFEKILKKLNPKPDFDEFRKAEELARAQYEERRLHNENRRLEVKLGIQEDREARLKRRTLWLTGGIASAALFGGGLGGYFGGKLTNEKSPSSLVTPDPLRLKNEHSEVPQITYGPFHQRHLYVALAKAELPSTITNICDLVKKTINLDAHYKKALEEYRGGNKQTIFSPNAHSYDPKYVDKNLISALAGLDQANPKKLAGVKEALDRVYKALEVTEKRINGNMEDWLQLHPLQPRYDLPTFGPEENRIIPSKLVEYASSAVDELLKNPAKSYRSR